MFTLFPFKFCLIVSCVGSLGFSSFFRVGRSVRVFLPLSISTGDIPRVANCVFPNSNKANNGSMFSSFAFLISFSQFGQFSQPYHYSVRIYVGDDVT